MNRRPIFWFVFATGCVLFAAGVAGGDLEGVIGGVLPMAGGALGLFFLDRRRTATPPPPRLHFALLRTCGVIFLLVIAALYFFGASSAIKLSVVSAVVALTLGYFVWIGRYTGRM